MKVRIDLTVDIDVDAWMLNYGVEKEDVRADVQESAASMVVQQLDGLELLVRTEVL
jgi:hypothetical protein